MRSWASWFAMIAGGLLFLTGLGFNLEVRDRFTPGGLVSRQSVRLGGPLEPALYFEHRSVRQVQITPRGQMSPPPEPPSYRYDFSPRGTMAAASCMIAGAALAGLGRRLAPAGTPDGAAYGDEV